jgi:hypothetical protein
MDKNMQNDQPAKIQRVPEDAIFPYFEEIEDILERRIEEVKKTCHSSSHPSCHFKPAQAGHWIFVR